MFYFHCIAIVFLFIFPVTFFGCDDNVSPVNKGGNVNHKDTSIFYGTWVSVFDTSDNPPGDKESKLMHWCKDFLLGLGECATPDTFTMNDSIMKATAAVFNTTIGILPIVSISTPNWLEQTILFLSPQNHTCCQTIRFILAQTQPT